MALPDDSNFAVLASAFHVHSALFPTPSGVTHKESDLDLYFDEFVFRPNNHDRNG